MKSLNTGPATEPEAARNASNHPFLHGLDGLTLYEKKCVLVNREIDAQGMGRYQWYIWGLCGFGYMLDLLWAQAFGLVLSPLQQELGFGNDESGNISTSFNAGLTAGAFVWGLLADIIGAITLSIFILRFFIFKFRETPKYLIYRGRDDEALQTLQHMAKTNGKVCGLTAEMFDSLESEQSSLDSSSSASPALGGSSRHIEWREKTRSELSRYKMLFDGFQMTRLTILTWLTYIMDFWGFTVAGFYLPRILALKNGSESVSLSSTYAAYIYTYAPGIVGVLLGAMMYRIPAFGRKWAMVLSAALMGTSILLFSTVDTRAKNEGLFAMEYFFQSMFNAVLYGWTPEAFPAPVRGTACGLAGFWGRLFGIVSPLIAQHLYGQSTGSGGEGDINSVLYLAGGVMLGCVISTALLPTELMETQDERS
ncbi:hypothetical protein Neosp_009009 [[Neocosmospora] mangrovei]